MFTTQSKLAFKMIRNMSSTTKIAGQPQIHMNNLHLQLNKNERMSQLNRKVDFPETKQEKTTMKATPKMTEYENFAYLC